MSFDLTPQSKRYPIDYNVNAQPYSPSSWRSQETPSSPMEQLKVELRLKDSLIESYEREIEKISQKPASPKATIPSTFYEKYRELAEKAKKTELELKDTKQRLEAIMVAISLNPGSATTKLGRYDEEEMAHRIISKMRMLNEENTKMAQMLSYGKSKEKSIELALLRNR